MNEQKIDETARYVDGAIRSGERAATEALKRLNS